MNRLLGPLIGLALYLGIVPLLIHGSSYWLTVFINISLLAFTSLGVWLTFYIGRINIAQGAFALIGGYAVAVLTTLHGWPFWLALPMAGLVAGLVGGVVGSTILRLRGVYFAMLTLCLTEATRLLALNWTGVTQGASGIIGIPTPFGGDSSYLQAYFFSALLLLAGLLAIWRITQCRMGRVFRALQAHEDLAASIGINVAQYRVLAFSIACAFGGLGGAVLTVFLQSIYPTSFNVTNSTDFMLYCFLGGLQFVLGPAVGALVLFLGFQLLSALGSYQALVYAILMVLAMLLLPNGLLSLRFSVRQKSMREGQV
ncbi:MAG: branched-chain amino acid ABC transporter permease [Thermaceae bacterium]|nr:branched-chain amino acid ABC transporter permease [Thermaceae bacterium]